MNPRRAVHVLPRVEVLLNGVPSAPEGLVALEIRSALSVATQCELRFALGAPSRASRVTLGSTLSVSIEGAVVFEGTITMVRQDMAPNGTWETVLRGYDALEQLRRRWPVRAFLDLDAVSLTEQLAADVGLSVQSNHQPPTRAFILQHQRSDLDLVVREAARCGLYLRAHGGTLTLIDLYGDGSEPRALTAGRMLIRAQWEQNDALRYSSVERQAWTADGREIFSGYAFSDDSAPAELTLGGETSGSADESLSLASAVAARSELLGLRAEVVVEGDPSWQPGQRFLLEGQLETPITVTSVVHRLDAESGFVTELDNTPPAVDLGADEPRATLGEISAVEDPAAGARVKVHLLALQSLETPWLAVLSPGAGPGRGLVAMPAVGDRVLVFAPSGDYGQACVLGGLFGPHAPPDTKPDGQRSRRWLLGHEDGFRLELDLDRGALILADGRGTVLEMDANQTRLASAQDLVVEAPGQRMRLRAAHIDFENAR